MSKLKNLNLSSKLTLGIVVLCVISLAFIFLWDMAGNAEMLRLYNETNRTTYFNSRFNKQQLEETVVRLKKIIESGSQPQLYDWPDSYLQRGLLDLIANNPSWVFEPIYLDYTIDSMVDAQFKLPARTSAFPCTQIAIEQSHPLVLCDGGGFYAATREATAKYINPENWLDNKNIFQFLDLGARDELTVNDAVALLDTYPVYKDIAPIFFEKSKGKVNPIYLLSNAINEAGVGTNFGTGYVNGTTVYNYFGIGANQAGQQWSYAYNKGWTTKEVAIEGGANLLSEGYISVGQDTAYSGRWDIGGHPNSLHQYGGALNMAIHKGSTISVPFQGVDMKLLFKIPVYAK